MVGMAAAAAFVADGFTRNFPSTTSDRHSTPLLLNTHNRAFEVLSELSWLWSGPGKCPARPALCTKAPGTTGDTCRQLQGTAGKRVRSCGY